MGGDPEEGERRWAESPRRSRERRAGRRPGPKGSARQPSLRLWVGVSAALAVVVAVAIGVSGGGEGERLQRAAVVTPAMQPLPRPAPDRRRTREKVPTAAALRDAWSFARRRGGLVSFAVVDTNGKLRGRHEDRQYVSASIVKAMLLAAELRRLRDAGLPLDGGTEALLTAMITHSDNDAADTIYSRVGDGGLYDVAAKAGMKDFEVAGYWANAQVTAADQARLFATLDSAMTAEDRKFGLGLLGSVAGDQSWGVPAAAGRHWAVRFKGGWRETELGSLAHQAAELRDGGRQLSVAILTDGQPSHRYATGTIRGVAERLLDGRAGAERPELDSNQRPTP